MRKTHIIRNLGLAILLAASLPALLTGEELGVKPELRKEVLTQYKRLQTDVQFQAAKARLKGNVLNRPVVDSYLRALPIPPLEMFNLEMRTRRIDLAVPDFIDSYNERWKELHPQAARRYYGDEGSRRNPRVASIEQLRQVEEITLKKTEIGPNRNVAYNAAFPPNGFQSEAQIAVNPNNPNQIVAASNTAAREPVSCGPRTVQSIYYSNDAGATWGRTCAPPALAYGLDCAALGGVITGSDPALVWGADNNVYLSHLMICFNGGFLYSIVTARSQDGGATWSPRGVIKSSWDTGDVEDKELMAIDTNAASANAGRLYVCWNHNNDMKAAYSSDGGATWTERDLPTPPQGGIDVNCDLAVQKNGTVHVVMETISCGAFDCDQSYLYHSRSTDGGNTWSAPALVTSTNFVAYSSGSCPDAQDFRCLSSLGNIDVDNSATDCSGNVYIAYSDFPAGSDVNNMDILLRRSTNGGATWGPAVPVNDDATGRVQFNPYMAVDPIKGQPVVAWVDGRNDPANLSMDVFTARSVNCGQSFKKNVQVTKPSNEFNNNTISWSNESSFSNPVRNGNQFGDYMGVDARNGKAYVAWTDSRHFFPDFQTERQRENIGFAVVTFGPPAPDDTEVEEENGKASLKWKDHPKTTNLVGYNVYRVSGGIYTKIGYVPAAGASISSARGFRDTGASLETARTSSYAVAGVDSRGEEGPYSALFALQ